MEANIKATNENIHDVVFNEMERLGNNADLNHIDVSAVTNMESLFKNSPFSGDISNWDVRSVNTMAAMFQNSSFNSDISNWNTENLVVTTNMFHNNKAFDQDLTNWNTSKVRDMSGMFSNTHFNGDISKWDTQNVEDMRGMFKGSKFDGDISRWNTWGVLTMAGMFEGSEFSSDISNWDVRGVDSMAGMFKDSKFNNDIAKWDVSNVSDTSQMFEGSQFNGDISKWDVSNVSIMDQMFKGSKFSSINGDISQWDTGHATQMNEMFANTILKSNLSEWDTAGCWDMRDMLKGAFTIIPEWYKDEGARGYTKLNKFNKRQALLTEDNKWFDLTKEDITDAQTGKKKEFFGMTPMTLFLQMLHISPIKAAELFSDSTVEDYLGDQEYLDDMTADITFNDHLSDEMKDYVYLVKSFIANSNDQNTIKKAKAMIVSGYLEALVLTEDKSLVGADPVINNIVAASEPSENMQFDRSGSKSR